MQTGILGLPAMALISALGFGPSLAIAQTKPPESTSKIKKVLLYNKIGGWVSTNGIADVQKAFSALAAAKGFELVQSATDAGITPEYLNQFQVIVWNNNTNGAASVSSATARQAILDYLDRGGGWMLISKAGDHQMTWPGLAERLGTTFTVHGNTGRGEVVRDTAVGAHEELKWMMQGFPNVFELNDAWLTFQNTVRPLPGVTVVATARGIPGIPNVVIPMADSSGDHVYIWAREVGQGRLLYNGIGFGLNLMEQQDGIVPRLYWENLRYAAGDYRNGCTTPTSPGFDPDARVHIEAMCSPTGLTAAPTFSNPVASKGGRQLRLAQAPSGPFTARIRDIKGMKVWERNLPGGTGEMTLDDAIKPGIYLFEVLGPAHAVRQRLLLP